MKKLFLALAISAFFVACNDASTTTDVTTDSVAPAAPMVSAPDSAGMHMMDSTTMKTTTDSTAM